MVASLRCFQCWDLGWFPGRQLPARPHPPPPHPPPKKKYSAQCFLVKDKDELNTQGYLMAFSRKIRCWELMPNQNDVGNSQKILFSLTVFLSELPNLLHGLSYGKTQKSTFKGLPFPESLPSGLRKYLWKPVIKWLPHNFENVFQQVH